MIRRDDICYRMLKAIAEAHNFLIFHAGTWRPLFSAGLMSHDVYSLAVAAGMGAPA